MKSCTYPDPSKEQLTEIEAYVRSHPNGNYFQSPQFFNVCKASPLLLPMYCAVFSDANVLIGTLLAFRQVQYRFFPLNVLSSRSIIWGGPLVSNHDPEVLARLLTEYETNKPKSIYTQIRNLSDSNPFLITMQKLAYQYEEHLNILVDLEKSEEQLWQEVHTKRRNEIRRAAKENTFFELSNETESLKNGYGILVEVYRRTKLPLPALSHFESLLKNSTEKDGLKIFVAKFEGKIIGCMFCLAYGGTLFDYYAGAYRDFYSKYPNDLIPWEVFKWGKQNGYLKFDFGGAGKPGVPYGVREYKKKFGGEMVNFGRYEKIHHPHLYQFVSTGFKLWKALKK